MRDGPLIGRETEVATIKGFMERVAGGPACLALTGEAGIGKTALWESAVEDASHGEGCVLVHRAVEAEAALSLAGLADLVSPVFRDVSLSLPQPQRRALEVALRLAEPADGQPADQFALGLALLRLLQALAARQPVVLAIDDLQWVDSSTAAILGLALRRLDTEPVGLLVTVREGPWLDVPLDLDRSFTSARLERISVGPLTLGDLDSLLRERLRLELSRPELTRVWASAGGNSYFALELGRELVRTKTRPEVGRSLRPPPTLRDLLVTRLAGLPAATRDVLLFAAALAQPSIELVAEACGDADRAFESLEQARREGLIDFADGRVRFAHPLLASVCYDEASPWRRRSVHRLLAEAVNHPEERARHLAMSSERPDEGVASVVENAALRAGSRGATAAGAELAELAVRLTSDENQADSRRRRMQAADLHTLSGDLERAERILQHMLSEVSGGAERADVLYALARNNRADMANAARLCREALAEVPEDDVRCATILFELMFARWRLGQVTAALESARAGLVRAERTDDKRLLAVALAQVAIAEDAALDLTPGLLERGIEMELGLDAPLLLSDSPAFAYAIVMMHRDQLDRSRKLLEDLDVAARSVGDEVAPLVTAHNISLIEWYAGRWKRAEEQSDFTFKLAQQTQALQYQSALQRYRALIQADLGRFEQARQSAEEGARLGRRVSDEVGVIGTVAALGRIELLAGNLEAAASHLRDLPDRALSAGWLGPDSIDMWPDSIETLVRLGELELAGTYLDTFEALAPRASRRWVAAAARCRGLFAAAARDYEAAIDHLQCAIGELDAVGHYPLDRGRALLVLGSVRRQTGQKAQARAALEGALTIFDDLGARAWSTWAVAELRRISGRRAPSHELTEAELRVATLASRGLSNQEIASALYMGRSTVEAHLSRVYGKLGVRRPGLATSLREMRAGHE